MEKAEIILFIILINAVIIILVSAIIAFVIMFRKRKIVFEKEKQLLAVEAMLKGQEEERSRLAKDLHDGLGGMLSGVKIALINLKENLGMDEGKSIQFEKSINQLDNTISELRKIAHNLMPETLVKFGLNNAIQDFCNWMKQSNEINIICEQRGVDRNLGNIVDVNIYRIIQELVNNAIKHANARQIIVQILITVNKVFITVEDDGKGFDLNTSNNKTGIGLENIKHRINYINGKLTIDSKPNDGTVFNIELNV